MGDAKNLVRFYTVAVPLVINIACPQDQGCKKQTCHGPPFRTLPWHCNIYKNSSLYNDPTCCRSCIFQYWKKSETACTATASSILDSSLVASSGSRCTP